VDSFDVRSTFEQATGIPLPTYYALLLGALSRFASFDAEKYVREPSSYTLREQWFDSTKVPSETVRAFFSYVSNNLAGFRDFLARHNDGPTDFTAFRDRPLLRAENTIHLFDMPFLAEKSDAGPFWTVLRQVAFNLQDDFQSPSLTPI
jgi:hypothetical protein